MSFWASFNFWLAKHFAALAFDIFMVLLLIGGICFVIFLSWIRSLGRKR